MDFCKYIKCILIVAITALICWGCYPTRSAVYVGGEGKKLTWAEMNLTQRKIHMRSEVLPRAARLFRQWRPERFSTVDCRLCHGKARETGNFEMPTAHLPRLSGKLLLGPEFEKHPETTRLKLDRLVPMISEALGLKPFRIITRSGFGCYSCHLGPDGPKFGN